MKIRTKWPKNRRPTTPPVPSVRTAPANRNVKFLKKNEKKVEKSGAVWGNSCIFDHVIRIYK